MIIQQLPFFYKLLFYDLGRFKLTYFKNVVEAVKRPGNLLVLTTKGVFRPGFSYVEGNFLYCLFLNF